MWTELRRRLNVLVARTVFAASRPILEAEEPQPYENEHMAVFGRRSSELQKQRGVSVRLWVT